MNTGLSSLCAAACLIAASTLTPAVAAGPEEARGLWLSAAEDAVLDFQPCADNAGALCGRIVWDKDAGTPKGACGVVVAQLGRYDAGAWRDGWVFDPRDQKTYKGVLRVKSGELHLRAFVGTELLGQTERLRRVGALPTPSTCPKA